MKAGTRVGPYEIVAPLGAGGMGEVYRARDTRLGRDVAIKILPAGFAADSDRLRRFEQEARTTAALNHPNILAIHDIGTYDGAPYLVEELLEGETLRERLAGGPLPLARAIEYAVQMASGLAAAHGKGIVHRDLKPENVFLTRDGHVKILDFGLAKLARPEPSEQADTEVALTPFATAAGAILGTVGYMAPEQVRGITVDHRTDIFALGCLLYEMLSGQRAFQRESPSDSLAAILRDDPEPLASSGRQVPPALQGIVGRCLEKRPEERFSSAHDLALALQAQSGALAVSALSPPAPSPRRWPWITASVLATVAVAIAVYTLALRGSPDPSAPAGGIRSIAVLPLTNLTGDASQEYFSDGMTEQLTATLAQISALKVVSRTSSARFKGTSKPIRAIAAELGVEGVIEGSVLRSGERIRVTAQLIDAATDTHVWARVYERDLKDVMALQNELTRAIAGEVRAKLTPQEQTRLAGGRGVNPEAFELVLKARRLMEAFSEQELARALELLERAIAADPSFAPAHAAVGQVYVEGGLRWGFLPPYQAVPKARAALQRALELDEGLAEARCNLGTLEAFLDWNWAGADEQFRLAIELDRNNAHTRSMYSQYLTVVGRFEAAVAEQRRALELDPLTPYQISSLGWVLYYAGEREESIDVLKKTVSADSLGVAALSRAVLAQSLADLKRFDEAVSECDQGIASTPEDQNILGYCSRVFGLAGRPLQVQAILERLKALSARHYVDPEVMGFVHDWRGDSDRAMEWLERSVTERSPQACFIGVELFSDRLRADPRYQDLVRRMSYPAGPRR